MFYSLAIFILFLPIIFLYPTKVIGKENYKKGKMIATSNHYSLKDPLIMIAKFRTKFRFVAKKELFKNKFLALILKGLKVIPVDRENPSPSTYKQVMSELKNDKAVFIFPEGTRRKEGKENASVKEGIITFASKGDAEIVPMLFYQKPRIFRKNYIIVGEPMKIEGENPKKLTKEEKEANLNKYIEVMNDLQNKLDEFVANKKKK